MIKRLLIFIFLVRASLVSAEEPKRLPSEQESARPSVEEKKEVPFAKRMRSVVIQQPCHLLKKAKKKAASLRRYEKGSELVVEEIGDGWMKAEEPLTHSVGFMPTHCLQQPKENSSTNSPQ